jgi:hypothetical protein
MTNEPLEFLHDLVEQPSDPARLIKRWTGWR